MRKQGILKQWITEKGFGFIRPDDGGKDIFIHITAFPKDGVTPRIGEKIRYEISADQNGKPQAVHIERLDVTPIKTKAYNRKNINRTARSNPNNSLGIFPLLISMLIVIGIMYTAYGKYQRYQLAHQEVTPSSVVSVPTQAVTTPSSTSQFKCDGRQHCNQMHSYQEAVYFIKNCPNTKMDGDNDGEPCEGQF